MGDRYRLFLVENLDAKPVIIILPSRNDPQSTTLPQKILAVLVATIASLETGEYCWVLISLPIRRDSGKPYRYAGIVAVLAAHELGHRLLARRHQVRLSPPFSPTLQVGALLPL